MKRLLAVLGILAITLFVAFTGCKKSDGKVVINALFMKQAGYSEADIKAMTDEFMAANPNVTVEATFVAYEELEPKILTAAESGGYDVVLGDCIWPPKFAKAKMVLDVTDRISADLQKDIFKGAIESTAYNGRLYGMPWLNDVKYLFYNKKMLKAAGFNNPPKTWDEVATMSKAIKDKKICEFPIAWAWKQAETIVCDYTCLSGAFGGKFTDSANNPTFVNSGNQKALEFMKKSLDDGISNPKSTEFLETDVLSVFSAGDAAFALNWTFMFNEAKDKTKSKVSEDVGITFIPGTAAAKSGTVNGGMPLMITAGSKNPDIAWNYITFISSKDVQKKYAKNALPIWISLYDDADVIATNPDVVKISKTQYSYLVNRPQVPYYSELSNDSIQIEVQKVLLGKTSPADALKAIQDKAVELANKK